MKPDQKPFWKRRSGIGLGIGILLLSVVVMALRQIEVPHPYIYDPSESAQRLQSIPENRRWMAAHGYGTLCAQNLELDEIRVRGDAIPAGLGASFYDGAAHHQRIDFAEIESWIQGIQRHVPKRYQGFFYDGIMQSYVLEQGTSPDEVMAFAARISALTGTKDLSNGIRIGLQQQLGADMTRAIEAAAAYPQAIHYSLFEELGWRVGNDEGLDERHWHLYREQIPAPAQCAFAEGMVRGAVLISLAEEGNWWPAIDAFHTGLSPDCGSAILGGLAEALLIAVGDHPDVMHEELARIQVLKDRQAVSSLMAQKQRQEDRQH
jgi:hypothetical protein